MNSRIRNFIGSATVKIALAVVVVIASICGALCWYLLNQPDLMLKTDTDTSVPALIRDMIAADTRSLTHEYWSPAMVSLAAIGPRVVPELIETIENARDLAVSKCGEPPSEFLYQLRRKDNPDTIGDGPRPDWRSLRTARALQAAV